VFAADVWLNKRSYTEAEHLNIHRLNGLLYIVKCLGCVTDNLAVQLDAIAGEYQSTVLCKVYSYYIAYVTTKGSMCLKFCAEKFSHFTVYDTEELLHLAAEVQISGCTLLPSMFYASASDWPLEACCFRSVRTYTNQTQKCGYCRSC